MNKASGADKIPAELFQILRDDSVKVLHLICQHIWKTQQRPQDQKRSVFIPNPKKGNAKEYSNYHTIAFISQASKVMLKTHQEASTVAQLVKNLPTMQETWVQSLSWEDPLEKGKATHSSILAWRISWTEEPGRLQSLGSQRVGHNLATFTFTLFQTSTVSELRTSRCSSWIQKRLRDQRSNCQHPSDHRKKQENSRKTSTSASLITLKPLTVWITTN